MSEPKSYVAKRGYAGIRRRLLFLLLLLAMTPLLALGLFCYDRLGALYDEKLAIGLESVTNSKHRALDTFLTERVSQIRTLAFTHSYEELSDPERLSSIFSVMQAHSRSFADVGIIGMDGKHVAYVGPFDLRTADYTSAEWFQAVLRRGVYVSDVFMGYRNVPHFIIAVLRHEGSRSFILRATIASLLQNRRLLRNRYTTLALDDEKPDAGCDNCANDLDWKFISTVTRYVEDNLEKTDFNVDSLCALMNMSRTSFYNKLKALTGQAPADYIRLIRLKRAAHLLKEKRYNITEISEMTGFNDVKYFREVFKKYYKVSPSQYAKGKDDPSDEKNT